jgi:hypothetical protein
MARRGSLDRRHIQGRATHGAERAWMIQFANFERFIRIGWRPPMTFAEVMRKRLKEEFPDLTEAGLDSIQKHHF